VFPEDYPASASAAAEVASSLARAAAWAARTPKGKRASDDARETAVAAAVSFARGDGEGTARRSRRWKRVVVRCFRGGNPVVGAAILEATPEQRVVVCPPRRGGAGDGAQSPDDRRFEAVFGETAATRRNRTPDRRKLAEVSRGSWNRPRAQTEQTRSHHQAVLGYVTSVSAPGASRGSASGIVDASKLKKTHQKTRERLAVALASPLASPAAVVPATIEVVMDDDDDPTWW
jgi:hypothetical protein